MFVGQKLLLGPNKKGQFDIVEIERIQIKGLSVSKALTSQIVGVQLIASWIKDGRDSTREIRSG